MSQSENKIKVEKLGIILQPTENKFEKKSVLNPGIYQEGNNVHIFYRAIDKEFISTVGYAKLEGPTKIIERWEKPIINIEHPHERKGIEDPRITKIDDTYYMTYVAHDGKNALVALAESKDLKHFKKRGIISPQMPYDAAATLFRGCGLKDAYFMFEAYYEEFSGKDVFIWEKDTVFFPKKINGKYAMLHRILPDIQIIYFDKFEDLMDNSYWAQYLVRLDKFVLLETEYWFEMRHIGAGAPPIETPDGWLLIFHSTESSNNGRVYRASAALLDKNNPLKVIGRLDYPLFSPEESWEKTGLVNNVVFPTGTAIFGDDLYIYYGAADKIIAVAKVSMKELIEELKTKPPKIGI
ncbi:MAG: pesticidal protein Cry7Aa [Candidatus Yanofskybacteria bacterium CG10_big_fil_rev_8_21_14_0_10_36_16]|uniref:Pesticidal protein Cry7Aa n=1 Tax=Candidatus Yanofskybacteria bacterium CG10_big_fil_rev_8_21_14_0_10_36_16 TaxID=1975096 RepID=A0A2J0Q805_9BACT|nr:MAG: pesticidal protein Cry7Aa [Candidatus Yanofskybacteria bacterium CG10_big_fil_rev_8_21_14_0_10_36_16]